MICLLNLPRSVSILRKLRYERLLRSTSITSTVGLSDTASTPQPISNEVNDRISLLCSRYSPSRTYFPLRFNDYIKLKAKLKGWRRYTAITSGYFVGCWIFAGNLPTLIPALMSDGPISFMGMEGVDPMFVGTSLTFVSGLTCAIISASGFRSFYLSIIEGAEVKSSYYQREEDFQRRLNFYRCTDAVEVGHFDDYYGDKINDLTDYRYWVRVQQMKHENSRKLKEKDQSEAND